MGNTLRIELAEQEGALMRLIGLIERRGFSINTLDKSAASNGNSTVTMQIASRGAERQVDVLTRQISKLFDVQAVFAPEMIPVSAHTTPGSTQCRPRA